MELVSMRVTACSRLGEIITEIGGERLLISVVVRNLKFSRSLLPLFHFIQLDFSFSSQVRCSTSFVNDE